MQRNSVESRLTEGRSTVSRTVDGIEPSITTIQNKGVPMNKIKTNIKAGATRATRACW
jgi:hypothetical protein